MYCECRRRGRSLSWEKLAAGHWLFPSTESASWRDQNSVGRGKGDGRDILYTSGRTHAARAHVVDSGQRHLPTRARDTGARSLHRVYANVLAPMACRRWPREPGFDVFAWTGCTCRVSPRTRRQSLPQTPTPGLRDWRSNRVVIVVLPGRPYRYGRTDGGVRVSTSDRRHRCDTSGAHGAPRAIIIPHHPWFERTTERAAVGFVRWPDSCVPGARIYHSV